MLVYEARARLEGRAPTFGDVRDIQAAQLLALYHETAAAIRRRLTVKRTRDKRLREIENMDAAQLEATIHPRQAARRR